MSDKVALTERFIKTVKPPAAGRLILRDAKQAGLYLQFTPSGRATWYLKRRVGDKVRNQSLGLWPSLTADDAREIVLQRLAAIARGDVQAVDPRRRSPAEMTLGGLWAWWREAYGKAKRTAAKDDRLWSREFGALQHRGLSTITRAEIRQRMSELLATSGPGAARKFCQLIGTLFNRGNEDLDLGLPNPAAKMKIPRTVERERYLQEHELPAFFEAVAKIKSETARDLLMLLIFTGARRSNVAAMRWDELDLKNGVWMIPAAKYKSARATPVALADPSLQIILNRESEIGSEWVFPGRSRAGHYSCPKSAWQRVVALSGLTDVRMHDLRRTLASWMAKGNASLQIIGKALGHKRTSATGIYARLQMDSVKPVVQVAASAILRAGTKKPPKKS